MSTVVYFLLFVVFLVVGGLVQERLFLHDSRGGVEEEREFDAVRLRGGHGAVVSLFVELFDFVFLGEGASDAEGAVERWLDAGVTSFATLH